MNNPYMGDDELLVPIPEPGSVESALLLENRRLRQTVSDAALELRLVSGPLPQRIRVYRESYSGQIRTLEKMLRRLIDEAYFVVRGGDDPHDRCPECGCAGYGMLCDAIKDARALLEGEKAK